MVDDVELITANERNECIFAGWEDGKSPYALSREFGISIAEIERVLDQMLPVFDAEHNLKAFKRELKRLEDLSSQFFAIAKRDANHESAHLVARLNERICAMRGWTAINIKLDPLATQVAQQPSSHEKIKQAIWALARPGQPMPKSGFASALSSPDDPEPSR